jgi:hypothetical protein
VLSPDTIRTLTGVLRSAALLFDEIVVPYSHLLDGASLLALGPDGVGELLGLHAYERLPIILAGPKPEIGENLREMSLSSGERLAPAIWSCASLLGIDPDRVARNLANRDAGGVRNASAADVPRAIALELQRAAGFADSELSGGFADLAAAWDAWADARLRDRVGYVAMARSGALMARSREQAAHGTRAVVGSVPGARDPATDAAAWSELVEVVTRSPSRSDVHIATGETSSRVAEADRMLLRAWWQGSYERVIATAVGASWARFTSQASANERAVTDAGEHAAWSANDVRISISGSIVELLADMTADQYRELYHQLRVQRAQWLNDPTPAHARDLSYGVASSRAVFDRGADLRRTVATLSASTASAIIGALIGWIAGASAGTLAIGLAVVAAIVTGPVNDLLRTRRFTRTELDSVIRHPAPH